MSISERDPSPGVEALTEAQLQQELSSLFVIDTQNYLHHYTQIAQHLQSESWKTDIQELYRCIHTIKGGAVTVAAVAVLHVTTALEDLLADLRYLEVAPPLDNGHLSQTLLEAGELLTSALDRQHPDETAPFCERIQVLHQAIRDRYLPQWDAQKQLHQEFAEQGLDMVVLELEIALERSPVQAPLSPEVLNTARQTLNHLRQIGKELHLAAGWSELLHQAEMVLIHAHDPSSPEGNPPDSSRWRWQWQQVQHALKNCAKQGGQSIALELSEPEAAQFGTTPATATELDSAALLLGSPPGVGFDTSWDASWDATWDTPSPAATDADPGFAGENADIAADRVADVMPDLMPDLMPDIADIGAFLEELSDLDGFSSLSSSDSDPISTAGSEADPAVGLLDNGLNSLEPAAEFLEDEMGWVEPLTDWTWETPPLELDQSASLAALLEPEAAMAAAAQSPPPKLDAPPETADKVRIPVTLETLDRSAQHLVDTLLTVRMTQGFHQTLRHQIDQITLLAQEGMQYISQLRQIQDDYALLNQLKSSTPSAAGPTPERYRQGYIAINRLLEVSLRLSEIGAEAEKSSQQVTETLRRVDGHVLKLQTTVEESRLVAFQNLSFRARAILRDLTTRYAKPARLLVQGESIELDASIARDLEPVLLHLIRNAYDHGLEPLEERIAQGKPEQGTIRLALQRQGNLFQFEIRDDGCGMNAPAIQARAEALGLPLTRTETPADLLAVICQPGFSSKTEVSELSGRGVGMDVVAAQVARLGGRLSLETKLGVGTTFRLQFPAPRLLVPCMLLQVGDYSFAIPVDEVKTTTLVSTLNLQRSTDATHPHLWVAQTPEGTAPALDVLHYWQPHSTLRNLEETAVCIRIQSPELLVSEADADRSDLWLIADDLLDQSELFITPLPSPLVAPEELIGVSLQASGALIPVLEPRTLAQRLLTQQAQTSATTPLAPTPDWEKDSLTPVVLIVDDAALMRRRLEASLRAYGYVTHTCADGREAWQWLHDHPQPSLVITDIEMPNMDGFTLIERCRQADMTMPMLVISSRLSEEWFNEARRLGANDYLTKGFATAELIHKVNQLLDQGPTLVTATRFNGAEPYSEAK